MNDWFIACMTNMFGPCENYDRIFDPRRGAKGAWLIGWNGERGCIHDGVLDRKDPLELLAIFRCESCGISYSKANHKDDAGSFIRMESRPRGARVCETCRDML